MELTLTSRRADGTQYAHTAGIQRHDELTGPPTEDELKRLEIRRKLEYEIIRKFDRSDIADPRKDCWFLMDCRWLNDWAAFIEGKDGYGPPGPISSYELLDEFQNPLPKLCSKIDYRGVPSLVFFIFVELYGRDASPILPRYVVDIYQVAVPLDRLAKIQYAAQAEAKIRVGKIRPQWVKWELDDDDEDEDKTSCCCGLTRQHLEALIYWAILCCSPISRKKSGRKGISYRQYKPLQYKEGDSTHGLDGSSHHEVVTARGSPPPDGTGFADKNLDSGQWFRNASLWFWRQ